MLTMAGFGAGFNAGSVCLWAPNQPFIDKLLRSTA